MLGRNAALLPAYIAYDEVSNTKLLEYYKTPLRRIPQLQVSIIID